MGTDEKATIFGPERCFVWHLTACVALSQQLPKQRLRPSEGNAMKRVECRRQARLPPQTLCPAIQCGLSAANGVLASCADKHIGTLELMLELNQRGFSGLQANEGVSLHVKGLRKLLSVPSMET